MAAYDPRFAQSETHMMELIVPANEKAANREAERLRERGNKPAYCYNRYYQVRSPPALHRLSNRHGHTTTHTDPNVPWYQCSLVRTPMFLGIDV